MLECLDGKTKGVVVNDSKVYRLFKFIVGDAITSDGKPQKITSLRSTQRKLQGGKIKNADGCDMLEM